MRFDYTLEYTSRKTICVTVERDRTVTVRAPHNTSEAVIGQALEKRENRILEKINHPQKFDLPHPKKLFVSGTSLYYLGDVYRLEITENTEGVQKDDHFFYIGKHQKPQANDLFKNWYIQAAKTVLIPKIAYYAQSLGVRYQKVFVSDLHYRWGSCTPNKNLNFNWRLIKAPIFVIEYVIVHELTHLIEANHTPAFWQSIGIQLPFYEKRKIG